MNIKTVLLPDYRLLLVSRYRCCFNSSFQPISVSLHKVFISTCISNFWQYIECNNCRTPKGSVLRSEPQSILLFFSWAILSTSFRRPRCYIPYPSSIWRIHMIGFRGVKRWDGNCRVLRARLICISMASLIRRWITMDGQPELYWVQWIAILNSNFL